MERAAKAVIDLSVALDAKNYFVFLSKNEVHKFVDHKLVYRYFVNYTTSCVRRSGSCRQ